jgi:3-hydroxybutyryl-CoA dehydratase
MTGFTALRYQDLAVGHLETVTQQLTPALVSRWRALAGYRPKETTAPSSLALTWLLDALRQALHGIPAGGVLMRHELVFGSPPPVPAAITTRVAVAELVERRGRPIAVFQLDSAVPGRKIVGNRMHLIWPSANRTALRSGDAPTAPGDSLEVLLRASLTQDDIDAYANLTGDHNPLHVDPEAGRRSPFGSTIAHGPLPLGFVQRAIEDRLGSEWPSGLRLDARFLAPTRPGDTVAVHLASDGCFRLVDASGRLLIDVRIRREG